MVGHGIGLGQLVALAFFGDHMQELRAFEPLDVFQRGDQGIEVMPVDGPDVVEAEFLEQRGRNHHALGLLLQPLGQLQQRGHGAQHGLAYILGGSIKLPAHELGQITIERAHGRADAHVVIVQDDEQVGVGHTGVVQGLEGHASGHGTVADDGHGMPVFALALRGQRHAQRGRDTGARMRRAKGVVDAFSALRKARDTAQLPQRVHAVASASQDLVRVGLVAHIPHQPILGRVEHMVQRHGEFDRAQIGAEVPARLGHAFDHERTQLGGQLLEIGARQAAQVSRVIDGLQQGEGCRGHLLLF